MLHCAAQRISLEEELAEVPLTVRVMAQDNDVITVKFDFELLLK